MITIIDGPKFFHSQVTKKSKEDNLLTGNRSSSRVIMTFEMPEFQYFQQCYDRCHRQLCHIIHLVILNSRAMPEILSISDFI